MSVSDWTSSPNVRKKRHRITLQFPTRLKYIFAHSDLVWLSIKGDQNGVFSIMFFTVSMKMGPRNKKSYISQGDCVIKRKVKSNEICKASKHSKQAAKKKKKN